MKEIYLIILLLYFGYRLSMGLFVLYNWNNPKVIEARKLLGGISINNYYSGVIENTLLLGATYLLYAS